MRDYRVNRIHVGKIDLSYAVEKSPVDRPDQADRTS